MNQKARNKINTLFGRYRSLKIENFDKRVAELGWSEETAANWLKMGWIYTIAGGQHYEWNTDIFCTN